MHNICIFRFLFVPLQNDEVNLSAARAERNLPVSVANACRPDVLHAKTTLNILHPYGETHANRFARKFLILNS